MARSSEAHPYHNDASDAASIATSPDFFSCTLRGSSESGHSSGLHPVFVDVTTPPPTLRARLADISCSKF